MRRLAVPAVLAALALATALAGRRMSPAEPPPQAHALESAELDALARRALLNLDALSADPAAKAFSDALAAEPGLKAALAAGPDEGQRARFQEIVARHAPDTGFRAAVANPQPKAAGPDCAPPPPKPALAPAAAPEPGCADEKSAPSLFPGQNPASPTP